MGMRMEATGAKPVGILLLNCHPGPILYSPCNSEYNSESFEGDFPSEGGNSTLNRHP